MFDYYGSKNQLAKMYPEPRYGLIVEPFAGSAGYSMYWLQKRPDIKCVLVEKSDRVFGMWTWFIDPPYQPVGGVRGNGYDKKCQCSANFIDFPALGEWCKSRMGQVIVCEQEGANWLPFRVLRETTNSQDKKYKEMIWTN